MALYPYVATLAVDPLTLVKAAGATGQIFAPADTNFTSPLTATDATGNPITLTSNVDGILPSFYSTEPAVNWRSGAYVFPLVTSVPLPGPEGQPGMPGTDGKDGSNVVPTMQAITDALLDPDGEPRAVLSATIAEKVAPVAASKLDRMQVTSRRPGTASAVSLGSMQIRGYDPVDNLSFWTDLNFIYRSVDGGVTRGAGKIAPTGVNPGDIAKFVRFKGNIYALASTAAGTQVFRAAPVHITMSFTWSAALHTLTTGSAPIGSAMSADANYLYLGEYGEPSGGPSIWRSADGTTWEKVVGPFPTRHIHAVTPDPYRPGHVYATIGDTNLQPIIWRSTNYGAPGSWAQITNDAAYLSVQISFSEDYVWFAGDGGGFTVAVMDRDELIPRVATPSTHTEFAVPGGIGRRVVTDGNCTNGSTTLTSATANFTAEDRGRRVYFPLIVPNVWINAVISSTQVTMSAAAFGTSTTQKVFIDGDRFMDGIFYGAVDPATGIYYCIANDVSGRGTRSGLFMLPAVGAELVLLETFDSNLSGEMFVAQGKIMAHSRARTPLALAS